MSTLDQIAIRIIKEQELIIGPLAWKEAEKVDGIHIKNPKTGELTLTDADPKITIDHLVAQYERLFGRASHEACREAVAGMLADLSPAETPSSLLVA